jgi:hypothetical protein
MDRNLTTDKVSAYYSLDGTNWTFLGETSHALVNPRLCVWAGGYPAGTRNCDIRRVEVVTSDDPVVPVLLAQPQQLVFNSVAGQACTNIQKLRVAARVTQSSLSYSIVSNASWLSVTPATGNTAGSSDISVNTAGLAAGTYDGTLQITASGATPAVASVKLIVNPAIPASVATWQGGKSGAMTIWVDDSQPTMFDVLNTNGFSGTYALWGVTPIFGFFTNYYLAGMEMAGHTFDHPCIALNEPTRRYEIERNITDTKTDSSSYIKNGFRTHSYVREIVLSECRRRRNIGKNSVTL